MFLGDAYAWATPSTLATPASWRRLSPLRTGKKIKTTNQGKVFLELLFSFYLGDLVKKPPKGKKSVPFNKIVTWLLT